MFSSLALSAGLSLFLCAQTDVSPSEQNTSATKPASAPAPSSQPTTQKAPPKMAPDAEAALVTDEERAILESLFEGEDIATEEQAPAPPTSLATVALQGMQRAIQSSNPEIALILDVALAGFSSQDNFQVGAHDPSKNGFNLQQLELSMGASVDPYFRFDTNIVFAQFGVEVEEAYATTTSLPYGLQARAGQFLTRIGRINPTHPHSWAFTDQPLHMGRFFGGEGNRGLGVEGSWLTPLPWYSEVVVSVTDAGNACCNRSYLGGDSFDIETPIDFLGTLALKQFFPFNASSSLALGLNAQSGPNTSGRFSRTELYGVDLYYRYRPPEDPGRSSLSITSEIFHRRQQQVDGVISDVGGLVQAEYRFALRYEVAARLEAVTAQAEDPLDGLEPELLSRASAAFTFFPSHFSRLRLQTAGAFPSGGEAVYSAILALEVLIGAHGAHDF